MIYVSGILQYILGVSGVLHLRKWWIGLYHGSEQINSIIDRGLGACVGHALRVPMAGDRTQTREGRRVVVAVSFVTVDLCHVIREGCSRVLDHVQLLIWLH